MDTDGMNMSKDNFGRSRVDFNDKQRGSNKPGAKNILPPEGIKHII